MTLRFVWAVLAVFLAGPLWAQQDPLAPAESESLPKEEREASDSLPKEEREASDSGEYRTPLAGEAYETTLFGETVEVPARERDHTLAITLGATGFTPNIGGETVLPMFALYWERIAEERRVRAAISILVNEIDFAEHLPKGFEARAHWDNYTIPVESHEIADGDQIDATNLLWGAFNLWVGAGYRTSFDPGHIDNGFHVGVYYRAGYQYHERGEQQPDSIRTPTDTYVHGLRIQVRLDGLQRNLLELPHEGVALGGDVEIARRDHWREYGPQPGSPLGIAFDHRKTRDYYKLSGYLALALPVPVLSERHRVLGYVHAGWAPHDTLDRFSAFRLGGGPMPTEATDLQRNPLPGAVFDLFPVEDYVVATVEYRVELLFFLFLHLRATRAILRAAQFEGNGRVDLERSSTTILSAALTSGFIWDSLLYLEYAYDLEGTFRGGPEGHSFLVMWSKSF